MSKELAISEIRNTLEDKIKTRFMDFSDEATFHKELSFAVQLFDKNPLLRKCEISTVMSAVLNVAQTGLTLNPTNQLGYLIPSWNKKLSRFECQFRPSYQGLVKSVTDTGSIKCIEAHVVYEGDKIEFDISSKEKVKQHVPYMFTGEEKGEIIAAYSIAILKDGTKHCEVIGIQDIYDNVRSRSESYRAYKDGKMRNCTWTTDEQEMCRKAIIRRHVKYLPKSDNWDKANKVIQLDNNDYILDIDSNKVTYAYNLIATSTLPQEQKESLEHELMSGEIKNERCNVILAKLKDCQIEPIAAGNNYSSSDIQKKLDNEQ